MLTVADTGPGIAAEDLPYVFERFYRADKSRSGDQAGGSPAGSGLGLAICREIIAAHGGTITIVSEFGSGTAFTVTLPGMIGSSGSADPHCQLFDRPVT